MKIITNLRVKLAGLREILEARVGIETFRQIENTYATDLTDRCSGSAENQMARKEIYDKKFAGAVVVIGLTYVLIIVLVRKTLGGRAAARPTACRCRRLTADISPAPGVSTRLLAARGKAGES